MQVQAYQFNDGSALPEVQVGGKLSEQSFNAPLVHQLVVAYQANGRLGTKSQKRRSDVRGGSSKPWRQKGTGRARAGCKTGPLWRGGGVTFAAKGEQNFSQKMNKKSYRAALRCIVAQLINESRLVVVDALALEAPKTKLMQEKLKKLSLSGVVTLVVDEVNENALLASNNLPLVQYDHVHTIDPVQWLKSQHVVMTQKAFKQLEENLNQ